ncbi:MAG: 5-formyltetrahydrofolate cyclo-ligase [Deltaproteobacteria bacterium]|nr:5-formyltetrahydrofolate cyclo-ligase [Deltaproteobacteria bacterium]
MRKKILEQRQALSAGEVAHRSKRILDNFLKHSSELLPEGVESVALYFPIRGEVDTRAFHAHLRSGRKRCLFPRVAKAAKLQPLEFFEVADWSELRLGAFGIGEPVPLPGVAPVKPDVVLVPGTAFSLDAHRLGYGAGHYDATVDAWKAEGQRASVRLVGLAYEFQIVERLPSEPHDQRLDFVVGEERFVVGGIE